MTCPRMTQADVWGWLFVVPLLIWIATYMLVDPVLAKWTSEWSRVLLVIFVLLPLEYIMGCVERAREYVHYRRHGREQLSLSEERAAERLGIGGEGFSMARSARGGGGGGASAAAVGGRADDATSPARRGSFFGLGRFPGGGAAAVASASSPAEASGGGDNEDSRKQKELSALRRYNSGGGSSGGARASSSSIRVVSRS